MIYDSIFAGRRLDFWVTGWGTDGTLTGVGEVLKLARPDVKIIATEPVGASLVAERSGRRTRFKDGLRMSCRKC